MRVVAWLLPFSSLHISVVEVAVVVTPETGAESSRAVVTTWPEFVREQPLVVETAITWESVDGLLKEAVALHTRAQLPSVAILVT